MRNSIRTQALMPIMSALLLFAGCGEERTEQPAPRTEEPTTPTHEPPAAPQRTGELPDSMANALLLAYSQFPVGPDGRIVPQPGAARLEMLVRRRGEWHVEALEDSTSDTFHKAMLYDPPQGEPGILTVAGTGAAVKLWRRNGSEWQAETIWAAEFGGRRNRMRDIEIADLFGDGKPALAVATHDQGVVSVIRQNADGTWQVRELDRRPNTFVHEIEIGDLNRDGTLEVYATPSDPNDLGGGEQRGEVVRYVPREEGATRTVVADLGERHAKEIWVGDIDGDGRDELYVAVEAATRGQDPNVEIVEPVEIRRYDHDTAPNAGVVIARIQDRLTRFLTAGDVDGDGRREMIAASFSSGVWLLRPGRDPRGEWSLERVDPNSAGFEHAAIVTDLDGNGADELYVAADEQGEVRRYVWVNGRARREVIHRRDVPRSRMTWNIMPAPAALVSPGN